MGLHQTKSFCTSKEVDSRVGKRTGDQEKVFIYHILANRLTGKIYKVLSSKKQNNHLKAGKNFNRYSQNITHK